MTVQADGPPTLDLRISRAPGEGYLVEIRIGEREYPVGRLAREVVQVALEHGDDLGARLFAALVADEPVRMAWNLAAALHPRRRIRVRIADDVPELHPLPWEALHDPSPTSTARSPAADRDTPFARFVATSWAPLGPVPAPPIKVLSAVAAPADLDAYQLPPIDRAAEAAGVAAALALAPPGRVEHTALAGPCTLAALEAELERGYHLLHLVAHGSRRRKGGDAVTFFEQPDGRVDLVDAGRFAAMVERLGPGLRLAVLMSCHSATRSGTDARLGLAPQLLAAGVPAVLAMQDLIPVDTAHAFTRAFYGELWSSGEIDRAANRARATLLTERLRGGAIPVLYTTPRSDLLWEAAAPPAQPAKPAPVPAPAPDWEDYGGDCVQLLPVRHIDGRLSLFAVDRDDTLHVCQQDTPGDDWTAWDEFAGNTRHVQATTDHRGGVCLFTLDAAGAAWRCREATPGGDWDDWEQLGGKFVGLRATSYVDGSLAVFGLDARRRLAMREQDGPEARWSKWEPLGDGYDQFEVVRDGRGCLSMFARGGLALWHVAQSDPEGDWDDFAPFEGEARTFALVTTTDGRVQVWAIRPDGSLWQRWQQKPGGDWGRWVDRGGVHRDLAVLRTLDRKIAVFTVGSDGAVWHLPWTGDRYGAWVRLGGERITRVHVAESTRGRLELFAADEDDDSFHLVVP
jgi:hypothetical protein